MKRRGKKGKSDKFVGIFSKMYISPAFKGLSPNAVRILIELKWRYNGFNNAEISISIREIKKICSIGSDSATGAIMELLKHGFIRIQRIGLFTTNMASTYELTFEDVGTRKAKNDWGSFPHNMGNKIEGKTLNEYLKNLDEYLADKVNVLR